MRTPMVPTRADPTLCRANWWGETVWVRSLGIGDRAGRHRPCRPGRSGGGRPAPSGGAGQPCDRQRTCPAGPGRGAASGTTAGHGGENSVPVIGEGAVLWLKEAAAQGTSRILVKMDHAVSIATHRCGPN